MSNNTIPSHATTATAVPDDAQTNLADMPLSGHAERVIRQYLIELNGNEPHNLYDTILSEIEEPLLSVMVEYSHGNQTKMAKMLGLSRNTLRKKLAKYDLM